VWLTGRRPESEVDRVLATVMIADIIDSTKRLSEHCDREWKDPRSPRGRPPTRPSPNATEPRFWS